MSSSSLAPGRGRAWGWLGSAPILLFVSLLFAYRGVVEYDPDTAAELSEFVEVGQQGEIVSWCWVEEPREAHPMEQPFAWAMIKLDGADVPMIHCVAASAEDDIATGARVQAVWADETIGYITDIRCFELV